MKTLRLKLEEGRLVDQGMRQRSGWRRWGEAEIREEEIVSETITHLRLGSVAGLCGGLEGDYGVGHNRGRLGGLCGGLVGAYVQGHNRARLGRREKDLLGDSSENDGHCACKVFNLLLQLVQLGEERIGLASRCAGGRLGGVGRGG